MKNANSNSLKNIHDLDVQTIEPVEQGHLTNNFKISTVQGNYFLKQHRAENVPRLDYITAVESFFCSYDIPIVMPILDKNKKSYFKADDQIYTLYPFIQNNHKDQFGAQFEKIARAGAFLGRLHRIGQNDIPKTLQRLGHERWDSKKSAEILTKIQDMIHAKSNRDDFDRLALETIDAKLSFINQNKITFDAIAIHHDTLIHGDFHFGNCFFDDDNEICALFDFEKACYAPREREYIRALFTICVSKPFVLSDLDHVALFARNYQAVFPIISEKIEDALIIHKIRYFHSTWIEEEHYLKNNFRLDILYPRVLQNIEFFNLYYEMFKESILSVLQ